MTNDNINTNMHSSSYSSSITQLTESETVTIRRPANHNEISIMESDWNNIRKTVHKIKISKHLNVAEIILGAFIPYAIDVFCDLLNKSNPNFLPFFICLFLFIIFKWIGDKFPVLGSGNSERNRIYLDELNELLEQADSSNDE